MWNFFPMGAGGVSVWTPQNLSPLAWYYADASYVILSSDQVSDWLDRSGNSNDLNQGVITASPSWNTTKWVNSKPSIFFNFSRSLSSGSGTIISSISGNDKPFTLLITLAPADLDISRTIVSWDDTGVTARSVCAMTSNADSRRTRYIRQGDSSSAVTVDATTQSITAESITRIAYVFSGTTISTYVNGTLASNAVSANVPSATFNRFRVGDGPQSPEDTLTGYVTEIVICDYAITSGEVTEYQNYSVNTWGTGSVPADMITPSFVAAGAGDDANGTTPLDIPYPAGLQQNDLLIMQCGSRTANALPATVSGWVTFSTDTFTSGRQQNLYWKFATGSESGTQTVTPDIFNDVIVGRIYAFRNVRLAATQSGFSEETTTANSVSNTFNGPTLVCSNTNRLAVFLGSIDENTTVSPISGATGGTWSEPVSEYSTTLGNNFTVLCNTASMAGSGTISGGTMALGGSNDGVYRAFLLKGLYVEP